MFSLLTMSFTADTPRFFRSLQSATSARPPNSLAHAALWSAVSLNSADDSTYEPGVGGGVDSVVVVVVVVVVDVVVFDGGGGVKAITEEGKTAAQIARWPRY